MTAILATACLLLCLLLVVAGVVSWACTHWVAAGFWADRLLGGDGQAWREGSR